MSTIMSYIISNVCVCNVSNAMSKYNMSNTIKPININVNVLMIFSNVCVCV